MAYDMYTRSMLHFDGADGSATFTDETGKTWTAYGNAQLSTAQYKFGTASGLFDGTGDYISTPNNGDFDFGSGNFTVDGWFRFTDVSKGFQVLAAQRGLSYSGWQLYLESNNTISFIATKDNSNWDVIMYSTHVPVLDTWEHIAVVRNGNVWNLYVDGVSAATQTTSITIISDSTDFTIGATQFDTANYHFEGYVDEFRVSKGIARWNSNFTPPSAPYAETSGWQPKIIII